MNIFEFKEKVLESFAALESSRKSQIDLSVNFIEEQFIQKDHLENYRLYNYCINSENLVKLANQLRWLKDKEGFSKLTSNDGLINNDKFYEKLQIAEIGYTFSRLGYNIEIEPKLSNGRVADLKISKNNFQLYIELSEKRMFSLVEFLSNYIMENLSRYLSKKPYITYSGKLHPYKLKGLKKDELENIEDTVKEKLDKSLKNIACRKSKCEKIIEDKYKSLEFYIWTDKPDNCEELADQGFQNNSFSIEIEKDFGFIKNKLTEEIEQLEPEKPGLLIIYGEGLIAMTTSPANIISELGNQHENLIGVIFDHPIGLIHTATFIPESVVEDLHYIARYLYLRHMLI
ncbi:MAG: hypothetical protein QXL94_02765 [Candidatus Parvarchaeum sp.]